LAVDQELGLHDIVLFKANYFYLQKPAPVGAAAGCDPLILIFKSKIKGSQPAAAPTGL
jgi:hypothetical protein